MIAGAIQQAATVPPPASPPAVSIDTIKRFVCAQHGLTHAELISARHARRETAPRHMAIWLARRLTTHSLPVIGMHFGGRDHSTIRHACGRIEAKIDASPEFAAVIESLMSSLTLPGYAKPDTNPTEKVSTMAKKPRLKQASVVSPQNRVEVVAAIAELGTLTRQVTRIEADMNDKMAVIKTAAEEAAKPLSDRIGLLGDGIRIWCEAHRDELTDNGKVKTANLSSGEVKWRITPPKVTIKDVEAVLELLKKKRLTRFIRTKLEINKDAILADQPAVAGITGITIKQGEEFIVEPFETQLEGAAA